MTDPSVPQVDDPAGERMADQFGQPLTHAPDAWIPPSMTIGHAGPCDSPDGEAFSSPSVVEPPARQPVFLASGMQQNAQPMPPSFGWPPLDQMTWRQFELAMADAFRLQGYQVSVTPDGADGGVDLVLTHAAGRILVQCKHWSAWRVGVKTVRELYGVMMAQGATGGIVATSGRFTDEARTFARNINIQLLGRDDVTKMLSAVSPAGSNITPGVGTSTAQAPGLPPYRAPRCPRCGEPLVIRTTRRGPTRGTRFWGCPRYPACRGIVPMTALAATATQPWMGAPPSSTPQPQAGHDVRSAGRRIRTRAGVPRWARAILAVALVVGFVIVGPSLIAGVFTTTASRIAAAPTAGRAASATQDPRIVTSIPVVAQPHHLALDPASHRLYVTNVEDKSLTVINTLTTDVMRTSALARQPSAIAIDTKAQTLWVTNYNDATVSLLDTRGKTKATIKVGRGPVGVALDPGLHRAYVMNSLDKTISIIDTSTHKITASRSPGYAPGAAAVDPVQHRLCVVSTEQMKLQYCYDSALKTTSVAIANGDSIAVDAVTHSRYTVRTSARTLTVTDGTTGKTTTIRVGETPSGVAVDPTTHLAYVADHDGKTILVVRPS